MVRGSKARAASGSGRSAPRSMFEQFALEPIWRAYSVCEGEDIQVRGDGGVIAWCMAVYTEGRSDRWS